MNKLLHTMAMMEAAAVATNLHALLAAAENATREHQRRHAPSLPVLASPCASVCTHRARLQRCLT